MLVVEEAAPLTNSPVGQKCCNRIIRQGRKSQTGFVGIGQHPVKDSRLARATLQWGGRDLDRHPELLRHYVQNTSPARLTDHGQDTIEHRYGSVIPGRQGEAWFLDEFGGFGKVGLFAAPTAAPTAALAAAVDTNPRRWAHTP